MKIQNLKSKGDIQNLVRTSSKQSLFLVIIEVGSLICWPHAAYLWLKICLAMVPNNFIYKRSKVCLVISSIFCPFYTLSTRKFLSFVCH